MSQEEDAHSRTKKGEEYIPSLEKEGEKVIHYLVKEGEKVIHYLVKEGKEAVHSLVKGEEVVHFIKEGKEVVHSLVKGSEHVVHTFVKEGEIVVKYLVKEGEEVVTYLAKEGGEVVHSLVKEGEKLVHSLVKEGVEVVQFIREGKEAIHSIVKSEDLALSSLKDEEEVAHSPVEDEIEEKTVISYLRENRSFLENFVMEEIEQDTIEKWIIRQAQRNEANKDKRKLTMKSLSKFKFCVNADKRTMLKNMTKTLQEKPTKSSILWKLSECIISSINADGANMYLTNQSKTGLELYFEEESRRNYRSSEEGLDLINIEDGTYICAFVAHSMETIRVSGDVSKDSRFPQRQPFQDEDQHHVLVMPVPQRNGELVCVIEFYRKETSEEFHEEDELIANSYLVWGEIALHCAEQHEINECMLSIVKSIFQDMLNMDTLIIKIMESVRILVNAERASLFILDKEKEELYPKVFDIGSESITENQTASLEIRVKVGKGIVGNVAQNGEGLIINDAYLDPLFNQEVDERTGYKTKSILCIPISTCEGVIGVVEMLNKKVTEKFTKEDQKSFEMFAAYCGLALHHANLYEKIRISEQEYKVASEMLDYHNSCSEQEFQTIKREKALYYAKDLEKFNFSPFPLTELEMTRQTINMFIDLFGLTYFDKDSLIRFCLTVRKNYRCLPYHNWNHGFSVANCMFAIIRHDKEKVLLPLERLSLLIGALCHDLDHRGTSNKFLSETHSPLAALYTTSPLEHHHFQHTIRILKKKNHNILSKLKPSEYKQVIRKIEHCILATDLAVFFQNKSKLQTLVKEGAFMWNNAQHRLMMEAVVMTASDLCASAKPWDTHQKFAGVIFEEFYQQGDEEKKAGKDPIPMMNRDKREQRPSIQVDFLSGICIPCYEIIAKLIPTSSPLLDGCKKNLEKWKRELKEAEKKKGNVNIEKVLQTSTSSKETSGAVSRKKSLGPNVDLKKTPDVREQSKIKVNTPKKTTQKDEATKSLTPSSKPSLKKKSETWH